MYMVRFSQVTARRADPLFQGFISDALKARMWQGGLGHALLGERFCILAARGLSVFSEMKEAKGAVRVCLHCYLRKSHHWQLFTTYPLTDHLQFYKFLEC